MRIGKILTCLIIFTSEHGELNLQSDRKSENGIDFIILDKSFLVRKIAFLAKAMTPGNESSQDM